MFDKDNAAIGGEGKVPLLCPRNLSNLPVFWGKVQAVVEFKVETTTVKSVVKYLILDLSIPSAL